MCSHGAIQRIHVSEATYQLLSTKYIFESRGEIGVKGKGVMRTYYLDARKMHTHSYAHAQVANFAQERNSFAMQERNSFAMQAQTAFLPRQPTTNTFFRPFAGAAQLGSAGALASEYSHNSGARTHRSSYVAARPSTASSGMREISQTRTSLSKSILSYYLTLFLSVPLPHFPSPSLPLLLNISEIF
jgi:hypothetical protein